MRYPRMVRLRQRFDRPQVEDVTAAVRDTLHTLDLGRVIRPGQTVALTAGSRGIANIPVVLRAVVRFLKRPGRPAVPRPGHGQPRRRHRRGAARRSSKATASPRRSSAPRSAPRWRSSRSAAPPKAIPVVLDRHACRGRPHRRRRPRQAAHQLSRPDRERPAEDDDDRPGQARRRPRLPPHPAGTALRPGRPLRRPGRCAPRRRSPSAWAWSRTPTTRRPWSRPCLPADFEPREEQLLVLARRWLARLPFARGRPAHRRRDRQGHQRLRHGHQRRRPQARLPAAKPPADQPEMRFIFVRGLSRAHARQRRRHRPGRLHDHAAGPGHELPGHRHQLPDGRLSRGRQPAGPFRHRPRGDRRGPGHPRHARPRRGPHHAHPQHARRGGSGGVGAVPGAGRAGRRSSRSRAGPTS